MIPFKERWRDWRSRRKFEAELAAVEKYYAPAIEKLKGDERQSEIAAYFHECEEPQSGIDRLETKYLKDKARSLGIEFPKQSDREWWEEDQFRGGHCLTEIGKMRLEKFIRQERWDRTKRILEVSAVVITALTGLLGALIGVLSLYKNKG